MRVIETKELTYIYSPGTSYQRLGIDSVSININKGEILGIVGENGSGKSTLIKHFNGLLTPTSGSINVLGKNASMKQYRNELWKNVGLVFQFPEKQLFEESVFEEIAYGLKNMKIDSKEIPGRVRDSLNKVGLDESIEKFPPVTLSGGLKRRTAIASILAMEPEILIMDEPTAGLDASGRKNIMELIMNIKADDKTIIIVSHNISEIISLCTHLAIMENGKMIIHGRTDEVLRCGLMESSKFYTLLPDYLRLVYRMSRYNSRISTRICSFNEAEEEMYNFLKAL